MAYNTFGWTPVASTNQEAPSSRRLLTPCFASTVMLLNATSICRMFRALPSTPTISSASCPANQVSGQADGSLEVRRSKSFLPRAWSNSSPEMVIDSVISGLYSNKFTKQREFLSKRFKEPPYLSLVLMSDYHGRKIARPRAKKIRRTRY